MSELKTPIAELGDAVAQGGGETLYHCMQCGLCVASCPWRLVEGEIARDFNTRKVQHMAQLGVEGYESANVLFACTTCGVCVERCPRKVDPITNMRVLRAMIAEAGSVPQAFRPVIASLEGEGNPWQGERARRMDWSQGLDVPRFDGSQEYFLFVCCTSCYDARSRKIARAVASLLLKAGVSFGVIGEEESCCGESARKTGAESTFQGLAERNIALFKERGVKKIITTSPHCLDAFRHDYAALGGEFEVVHHSTVLADLLASGRLKPVRELPQTVALHDPCYLGRHNEIFDAPRAVLDALPGTKRVELDRARVESLCCGGGGGRIWMETPAGARFGDIRVKDAAAKQAQLLVTACPYCTIMLDASNMAVGSEQLKVLDLAEVLEQAV